MCRLAAYCGPEIPLEQIIVAPQHSLLEQSHHVSEAKLAVNGDGFGFAWYNDGLAPGLYRDVLPAWSDGNLPSLCRMIRSRLFLAHVRASTAAETSRVNCHPFTHGRWSFMHNGQIPDIAAIRRPLEALLPDDVYALRRGSTDSELVFLLLLAAGLEDDPAAAITTVLALLRKHSRYGSGRHAVRLTCVLSDGENIFAFRHASDTRQPTLYLHRTEAGGWVLASEPLTDDRASWDCVAPDRLLKLSRDGRCEAALEKWSSRQTVEAV
ncbi:MAG: class II glutamine amidotransferase [Pseudomonadota bacterium]